MPLEVLHRLVERYFSTFLDRMYAAGGDSNETAGDGFMAVFQAADVQTHTVTAVETALALLGATAALNRANSTLPLALHMGLNSGLALVGATRFGGARDPLDLYGERPGDEPGGASDRHGPGRSAPGRSRDRPLPG